MSDVPEDVKLAMRTSLDRYLEADRAYHALIQDVIEQGRPLTAHERADIEEARQLRDYHLHVRMVDLKNIGWPTPHEVPPAPDQRPSVVEVATMLGVPTTVAEIRVKAKAPTTTYPNRSRSDAGTAV